MGWLEGADEESHGAVEHVTLRPPVNRSSAGMQPFWRHRRQC